LNSRQNSIFFYSGLIKFTVLGVRRMKSNKMILIGLCAVLINMVFIVSSASGQVANSTDVDISNAPQVQSGSQPTDITVGKVETSKNFYEIQSEFDNYWSDKTPGKGSGWKPFKRWEAFWAPRVYPNGNFPDQKMIINEVNKFQTRESKSNEMLEGITWEILGPSSVPTSESPHNKGGMGRINCVAFNPNDSKEIWAGAAFGGLWKTTTGGFGWEAMPLTDVLSIGISDIAVSHRDPKVVLAATGDADGTFGSYASYSVGIIKTTDGGETWNQTNFAPEAKSRMLIHRMVMHPENDSILIVGTNAGLYKTTDQGDTWIVIFEGVYCRDIEFKYSNPDSVYMAIIYNDPALYGVFTMNINDGTYTINFAFPYPEVMRIDLAAHPSHPDFAYALCVRGANRGYHSILATDNGGKNWYIRSSFEDGKDYLNSRFDAQELERPGQGHYDLAIAMNPKNANEVHIGGVNIWKSIDAGSTFECVGEWTGFFGIPYVHADQHRLVYSPEGNLYSCNDGGLNYTSNGGDSWGDISKGLEVTQFYKINIKTNEDFELVGGTQDNGTNMLRANGKWVNILGGDGMECHIDQYGSNVIASLYYGEFKNSTNGGSTFNDYVDISVTKENAAWVAPLWVNPKNSEKAYIGHDNVWYTDDRGKNWTKMSDFLVANPEITHPLHLLKVYEKDENYMYAAKPGQVWYTQDGGENWSSVLTGGMITDLAIDPDDPQHFWFTSSGYDPESKVYEYKLGTNLKSISEGLPNVPVNCITYQDNSGDKLFIGTDLGVFYRDRSMTEWRPYGEGMPNVVVADIEIDYENDMIYSATYGRGIWQAELVTCPEITVGIDINGSTELCPGDSLVLEVAQAFKIYEWSNGVENSKIVIKEAGKYHVRVEDDKGCQYYSEEFDVTLINVPSVSISSKNDFNLCPGDSVELKINPKALFKDARWSNGEMGRNIWVKEAGKYSAVAITKDGCEADAGEVEVVAVAKPEVPTFAYDNGILRSTAADEYQWYFNQEEINGATEREYTPTENGKYFVEVFNEAGCSEFSEESDIVVVSVEDQESLFSIYPNPSEGIFNIQYSDRKNKIKGYEVYDMQGIKIISRVNTSNDNTDIIDLREYPAGAYLLVLDINGKKLEKKIIKK
jgi:Secretion system C-terminal sorting domain